MRTRTLITIAALLVLAACGGTAQGSEGASEPPAREDGGGAGAADAAIPVAGAGDRSGTYVGTIEGTDAFVSVSIGDDGNVVVYLCDGDQLTEYLDGTIEGSTITADEPLGSTAVATLEAGAIRGTITLADGTSHSFSAEPAAPSDVAGAFWFEDVTPQRAVIGGWIRLGDGSVRGKVQTVAVTEGVATVEDGSSGVLDGSSNTAVPPEAEPTGILKDLRCGRNIRKQVELATKLQADPDNVALHEELFALEAQNERLGCALNPGHLVI